MQKLSGLDMLAMILVIIGGINWGLVGAFNLDVVTEVIGANVVTDIIFILVGVSAVYLLVNFGKLGKSM